MGAYIGAVGANIQTANMMRCLPGMYDIKLIDAQAKCVFTQHDADRALSRRRPPGGELLPRARGRRGRARHRHRSDPAAQAQPDPAKAMPYKTAIGTTYDSGDFATVVDKGLALADYDGFKARKRESKKRGLLRGLGICCVLEHSGGAPTRRHAGVVSRRRPA